jgi:hypothetical protein
MIGGIETHLQTNAGRAAMEAAVRAIRKRWQLAAFENGITGERYKSLEQVPFGEIEELFVYRDSALADQWDEEGAIPELANTMIHLLRDDDTLTIVVDEQNDEMEKMISAIRSVPNK